MYRSDLVYESMSVTIGHSFALRPCEESTATIIGVYGRALHLFPSIRLHAFNPLSNQLTDLISASNPAEIQAFVGYIKTNISKELRRLHDLPYPVFAEQRAHVLPISPDLASEEKRFRYVLSQGTKEDLVESPRDWRGATGVHQLETDAPLYGPWFDRSAEDRARRRGETFEKYEYATWYPVRLSPLPSWNHLPDWRERATEIISDIERVNRERREREGKSVLGFEGVMAFSPMHFPAEYAKSPTPHVLAASEGTYRAFRRAFDTFCELFWECSREARENPDAEIAFPPCSFPPSRPMTAGPSLDLGLLFALEPL